MSKVSPRPSQDLTNNPQALPKSGFLLDLSKVQDGSKPRRKSLKSDESGQSVPKHQRKKYRKVSADPKLYANVVTPSDSRAGEDSDSSSGKKLSGILKKSTTESDKGENNNRLEKRSYPVEKNHKRSKIAFRKDIEDVKIIENWKHYNAEHYTQNSCHCNIY